MPGSAIAAAPRIKWLGAKSLHRVRRLITNLAARYDGFSGAVDALRRAPDMDPATRQNICHWRLMLADPIYRAFAGRYLVERRASGLASVNRDAVVRFVEAEFPGRWAAAMARQFAQKLLAASSEAGLLSARLDPRKSLHPRVPNEALGYFVERRLRTLHGLRFRHANGVIDMEWDEGAPPLGLASGGGA